MTSLPLEIEISRDGDVIRVAIRGDVDMSTAPDVDGRVTDAFNGGGRRVVLDAEHITFLDSTGIRLLLRLRESARRNGCEFRIENASVAVRRTLDVTRLSGHFGLDS